MKNVQKIGGVPDVDVLTSNQLNIKHFMSSISTSEALPAMEAEALGPLQNNLSQLQWGGGLFRVEDTLKIASGTHNQPIS